MDVEILFVHECFVSFEQMMLMTSDGDCDNGSCQVQMVKSNGEIIYFNNPKLMALPSSNTFAVSGHTEIKSKSAF